MIAKLLPPEEWRRVLHLEPFASNGLPDPEHWRILIVEDDNGAIVGCSSLYDTVHWDGFWVDPEHQGKAAVFRAMVSEGIKTLKDAGVIGVHTTVPDSRPDLQALIERFGYVAAPG